MAKSEMDRISNSHTPSSWPRVFAGYTQDFYEAMT